MPLPKNIAAFVDQNEGKLRNAFLRSETIQPCEGAKFHSPKPLKVKATIIVPLHWNPKMNTQGIDYVWLCGTCLSNLRILNEMMFVSDGVVPWEVRREFGNEIRAIAQRGWDTWLERR